MTAEEFESQLHMAWLFCATIRDWPLDRMIAAAERALEVGWFLDPSLYLAKKQAAEEDLKMLRALRLVQTTIAAMAPRDV